MKGRPIVSLIAALASNRVIGAGNRLPWHLPEDLKYFKRVTSGHPIVMGRKTYESIGRLLPNRENRIVTRQEGFALPGARVFHSLEEACFAESGGAGTQEIFVIGGAEIYSRALALADRLYLTWIDREFEGDAYFPEWDPSMFQEVSCEEHAAGEGRAFGFRFVVLERKKGNPH